MLNQQWDGNQVDFTFDAQAVWHDQMSVLCQSLCTTWHLPVSRGRGELGHSPLFLSWHLWYASHSATSSLCQRNNVRECVFLPEPGPRHTQPLTEMSTGRRGDDDAFRRPV
ncbi:hypothetical protein DPEC_G00355770 [Dallia pectoralis]|uniref:Uncharacterized protein n=1 Tax=Dallia pectoralis TaxID=75939 RepID=A0ACC2EZK1_DALPE|nr:hypothetical protein DPEC_G00355770 [Dallia pectoralis]